MLVLARRMPIGILATSLLLAVIGARAAAQVPLSGDISDSTTGPLQSGVVYHATNYLTVPAGQTLTVQAGAIVKCELSLIFTVDGTLNVQGVAGNPAIFTCLLDDSAGGDTNGDGPSVGAPNQWINLRFNDGSDASVVDFLEVRFAGLSLKSSISLLSSDVTLRNVVVRDGGNSGLSADTTSRPTVSGCSFLDNAGYAVGGAHIEAVPGFSSNTASGNGIGNWIVVPYATLTKDVTIVQDNCLGGALAFSQSLVVPVGTRLTLDQGVGMKFFAGRRIQVDGALDVTGTPSNPAILTSPLDDTLGGDQNGDGPSVGSAGNWFGLRIDSAAATSLIENLEVRFGGSGVWVGFQCDSPNVTARGLNVSHSSNRGIRIFDLAPGPQNWVVTSCLEGIILEGGTFDLAHVTVANCGNTGLLAMGPWTGQVVNSISWNNGTNFSGFAAGELRYSDGDAALAGMNGNIDLDPLFVDLVGDDVHLLAGSPCIDTGDPSSPTDPDGSRADMGAYPFDHCPPVLYCTPKPNSQACNPRVDHAGTASMSSTGAFDVLASDAVNRKPGVLYYSLTGRDAQPFHGGTLCIMPPLKRTPIQFSFGGSGGPDCTGTFSFDFNAWAQGGNDPGLTTGVVVQAQYFYRDPYDVTGFGLTDAVEFALCP